MSSRYQSRNANLEYQTNYDDISSRNLNRSRSPTRNPSPSRYTRTVNSRNGSPSRYSRTTSPIRNTSPRKHQSYQNGGIMGYLDHVGNTIPSATETFSNFFNRISNALSPNKAPLGEIYRVNF